MTTPVRSAVLITASEPEPRSFGKQVVIGGLLDHLVARLGADRVHVVLVGRSMERPETPYDLRLVAKPGPAEQLRAVARRVLLPPHSSLQEAALWSPRVRGEIGSALAEIDADLEIWDTMRTGQYARRLPRHRRVLYADDLFSKRYASMIERIRADPRRVSNPLGEFAKMLPGPVARLAARPMVYRPLLHIEQRLTRRSEDAAPQHFDATVLVNPDETRELTERSGSPSVRTLLPLLREPVPRHRDFDGTPRFVFLGGLDFPPNRDGLSWFLTHCRAAVLEAVPDFSLLLVGRGSDAPLPEAEPWGDHVRPLGWVDDLDQVLNSAAALLSPLRSGSGIKIKVLEALARGLPVVATRQGVLGLDVGPDAGCLVADSPVELARLLAEAADPARNRVLSAAAGSTWRARFAPEVATRAYDEVLGLPSDHTGDDSDDRRAGRAIVNLGLTFGLVVIGVAFLVLVVVRPRVSLLVLVALDISNINAVIAEQLGISPYRPQLALAILVLLIMAGRRMFRISWSPVLLGLLVLVAGFCVTLLSADDPVTSQALLFERSRDVLYFLVVLALMLSTDSLGAGRPGGCAGAHRTRRPDGGAPVRPAQRRRPLRTEPGTAGAGRWCRHGPARRDVVRRQLLGPATDSGGTARPLPGCGGPTLVRSALLGRLRRLSRAGRLPHPVARRLHRAVRGPGRLAVPGRGPLPPLAVAGAGGAGRPGPAVRDRQSAGHAERHHGGIHGDRRSLGRHPETAPARRAPDVRRQPDHRARNRQLRERSFPSTTGCPTTTSRSTSWWPRTTSTSSRPLTAGSC